MGRPQPNIFLTHTTQPGPTTHPKLNPKNIIHITYITDNTLPSALPSLLYGCTTNTLVQTRVHIGPLLDKAPPAGEAHVVGPLVLQSSRRAQIVIDRPQLSPSIYIYYIYNVIYYLNIYIYMYILYMYM